MHDRSVVIEHQRPFPQVTEPANYYAATARSSLACSPLRGEVDVDVCVVGGGFTGVNTALELAEQGKRVALLEAREIGWGASGRNGGQLIVGMCETGPIERRLGAAAAADVWRLGMDCVALVEARIARHAIACDLKHGHCTLAKNATQRHALHRWREEMRGRGYPHRLDWLEGKSLRAVVGSNAYTAGVLDAGSGHLQPLDLCLGEAVAAREAGALLFANTRALRLRPGQRPVVECASGRVTAAAVVLAGNAYLGDLEPRLKGAVLPAGSYIVGTERLGAHAAELLPGDAACADMNTVPDYFRLSGDGRLLFGGLCHYAGRPPADIAAALRPRLARVFPALRDARFDYAWGGSLGISLNRIPQIGRLPGNIYYAQGYSGHGVGTSHMAAHLLAQAILGNAEPLSPWERIRHWRLPGGARLGGMALAAGRLWYRLRDPR